MPARSQAASPLREPANLCSLLPCCSSLAFIAFVLLPLRARMTSRGRHARARPGRRALIRRRLEPAHRHRRSDPRVGPPARRTPPAPRFAVGRAGPQPASVRVPIRDRSRAGRGFPAAAAGAAWRDVPSPCPWLCPHASLPVAWLPNADLARAAAAAVDLWQAPRRPGSSRCSPPRPAFCRPLVRYGRAAGPAGLATRTGPPPGGPVRSAPERTWPFFPERRSFRTGAGKNASSFRTERTGPPGGGPVRVSPTGSRSLTRPRAETQFKPIKGLY